MTAPASSPGVTGADVPAVLLASLGGTAGLREADAILAEQLRRAGADVRVVAARRPREWRTYALIELAWALNLRRAVRRALREDATRRTVIYSSVTAALLGPVPGVIRFDAPAAGNRPGRHGVWQRPVERARLARAPLLAPWSEGGLAEAGPAAAGRRALVVPVPVGPSGQPERAGARAVTVLTYGANPRKKGLDRVLAAWRAVRRDGETLVVAGLDAAGAQAALGHEAAAGAGVEYTGMLDRAAYRALLRRARVFACAPRREDYGIAQLEALADGAQLVTTASPGPYAALPLARELDPRLVVGDTAAAAAALGAAIRAALDDPTPDYAERALAAVAPWSPEAVQRVVAEELIPVLRAPRRRW